MQLEREVMIHAPASAAWAVLGQRFGHIGEWAAPITSSCLDGEPRVGAMRVCHIARFGPIPPGVIKERLTAFDPHSMELTYEAQEGMPRFIVAAVNRWSVHAIDEQSCRVRTQATLELRGVATLLGPLLKWRLRANGARVLEELRHQIEHGRPHPRKFAAMGRVHPAV